ncbi:hypothetical protein [Prevotella sp. P4-67]|uniref:hypothetical protein n=1 Tax=Prevotella sp. P4-67 TaxID=2024227 RepID=UPI001186E303|nr:hypothetical protein [Prevotella sp. P4-67]
MKQLFLTFAAALLLLPATLWADTAKKKIKSVEITIDAPTPGMDLEKAEKLALKAVNTAYGDLFKSGVINARHLMGWRVRREQGGHPHTEGWIPLHSHN